MARFSFSIPDEVAEMPDRDVASKGTSRSSLVAEYIEQFYNGKAQHKEDIDVVQRVKGEHEKKVQHLIAEHASEVQQIRTEYEQQLEQIKEDNAANTQQLENDVERLEKLTENLENDLKASEERNASAVGKLRQSESSKDVVVNGLQHEVELLGKDKAKLEALKLLNARRRPVIVIATGNTFDDRQPDYFRVLENKIRDDKLSENFFVTGVIPY